MLNCLQSDKQTDSKTNYIYYILGEFKDVWALENKLKKQHQLRPIFYKVRKVMETNNQTIEDFIHEASTMRQFDHPNILSVYGVSVHNDKPCVLLPLMSNGDLQKYLKDHNSVRISFAVFCSMV